MGRYRVYKVGEDEHVRVAGRDSASASAGRTGRGHHGRNAPRVVPAPRGWLLWGGIAAVVVIITAVYWFWGRDVAGNSLAALDMAKLTGKVPGWAMIGAPVVVIAVIALVTGYLAFGRRLSVKLVGVAAVVLVLAAPGLAVGLANGTVSVVAAKDPEVAQAVAEAEEELEIPLPNKAMNILLIGSDKSEVPGDPGRSDTQILVRLDPETKSISMFSVPRDLRVYIPDHGYDKMNTAYSYGGPALAVKTFKQLTGLPVNHFVEVNFAGFWHVVNILGGVYVPIDHRYFVPASADFKSINLQPGYQLVRGKQALNYVRYRHDQKGDFTRMERQQLFLKELQRQSGRWSSDWGKVVKLIRAITGETKSDLDSLKKLQPLVNLAFQVDTSKVYQVHLEGATPMIDGVAYVTATEGEVAEAVEEFTNPTQAPVKVKGLKVAKKTYPVRVYNGSGIPGLTTAVATQLKAQGYRVEELADAPEYPDKVTAVYAPEGLESQAKLIGEMLWPSDVRIVERAAGVSDGITVFVASSFDGTLVLPKAEDQTQQTVEKNQRYDWVSWRALDQKTPLRLEAPTAWSPGFTYDEFRSYSIKTTEGKRVAAAVAVISTPLYSYASVQAMRWLDPPAIEHPNATQSVKGTEYMLFYQGSHLHMVAWKRRGTLYWVLNTLDNQLSNDLMMGLATSFKPVK